MYGILAYFLGMAMGRLTVRMVSPGDVSIVYVVLRDFFLFLCELWISGTVNH